MTHVQSIRTTVGWGGFSVYRKISGFLKNRFCQRPSTEKPGKDEEPEKKEIKMLMFQLILAENL
jgi:hypothetical protein